MMSTDPTVTRRTAMTALGIAVTGSSGASALAQDAAQQADAQTPSFQPFELEELQKRQQESGRAYLQFLDEPTMSMGLYALPAGGTDGQQPHDLDEAYVVMEGNSKFTADGETRDVKPGDVLFVRAKAEHRFHDIEEDLLLVVFFTKARATRD